MSDGIQTEGTGRRLRRLLAGDAPPGTDAGVKEILNIQEAADWLGVSTKTFQKVLREGEMPGRKVGREWKFSRTALTAWIGAGRSRDFLDIEDDARAEESGAAPPAAPEAAAAAAAAATPKKSPIPGLLGRRPGRSMALDTDED